MPDWRWFSAARRWALKGRYSFERTGIRLRALVASQRPTVPLDQVQRRLDLMLTAMYGRPIPITTADHEATHWLARTYRFMRRDPRARESTAAIDGQSIHLPAQLSAREGVDAAVARYRLLAVEQAERLNRERRRTSRSPISWCTISTSCGKHRPSMHASRRRCLDWAERWRRNEQPRSSGVRESTGSRNRSARSNRYCGKRWPGQRRTPRRRD